MVKNSPVARDTAQEESDDEPQDPEPEPALAWQICELSDLLKVVPDLVVAVDVKTVAVLVGLSVSAIWAKCN